MRKMANKKDKQRKPISIALADALNAYQATGRIATVYPFIGRIALSGHPSIPYADALAAMRFCLEKEEKRGK